MTGIILAGGQNRRMGRNKALMEVGGKRIIDIILEVFKPRFSEIIIVTNTPWAFGNIDARLVTDRIQESGSLGGLYTGIEEAKYDECFAAACDMPCVKGELVDYIIQIKGYDIVVPKIKGFYEPLFASYSKKCAPVMREQLLQRNMKISDIYTKVHLREIYEDEMRIFDNELSSLININTPGDLENLISKFS